MKPYHEKIVQDNELNVLCSEPVAAFEVFFARLD